MIDFNKASKKVKEAFDDLNNLDIFFQTLSLEYNTRLHPRKSLIIFDEIQKFPKAREAIKYLAKKGRMLYNIYVPGYDRLNHKYIKGDIFGNRYTLLPFMDVGCRLLLIYKTNRTYILFFD